MNAAKLTVFKRYALRFAATFLALCRHPLFQSLHHRMMWEYYGGEHCRLVLINRFNGKIYLDDRVFIGSTGSVSFDTAYALQHFEADTLVGFYHTHPPANVAAMSQKDWDVAFGWSLMLGRPLGFFIDAGSAHTAVVVFPNTQYHVMRWEKAISYLRSSR